jgi:protein-disulfide isomerase
MNLVRWNLRSALFSVVFATSIVASAGATGCKEPEPAQNQPPPIPADQLVTETPGVDTTKLNDAQRESFLQVINTEPSACDKPHSLVKSLNEDKECRDSLIIAQLVADSIASGISVSDLRLGLPGVRGSLQVKDVPTDGRPVYGNETAPVTMVVFADFQCPHCAAEAPKLRKAVQQYRGQAKLVYRHFPLGAHPHAYLASQATEAAFQQSPEKFWEMHDEIFGNQVSLFEDGDAVPGKLRGYAEKIGLDLVKYDEFMAAGTGKAAVDGDRQTGEKLRITGTPAVFINGREYTPVLFGGTFSGWIDDALRR